MIFRITFLEVLNCTIAVDVHGITILIFHILVAHAAPPTLSDVEDGDIDKKADGISVLSHQSNDSRTTSQLEAASKLPWYRNVTCKDLKDITPTILILLGGILVMIFVIPYAFSSVIKQLNIVSEMDRIHAHKKEMARNASIEAANRTAEEALLKLTQDDSIPEPSRLVSSENSSQFSEGSYDLT